MAQQEEEQNRKKKKSSDSDTDDEIGEFELRKQPLEQEGEDESARQLDSITNKNLEKSSSALNLESPKHNAPAVLPPRAVLLSQQAQAQSQSASSSITDVAKQTTTLYDEEDLTPKEHENSQNSNENFNSQDENSQL